MVLEIMIVSMKDRARHYLNPLHVYCSLTCVFGRNQALRATRIYENAIYNSRFMGML